MVGVRSPGWRTNSRTFVEVKTVAHPGQELAAGDAGLLVAGAAIHGPIMLGHKWQLCLSSALSTNSWMHLTRGALRTVGVSCGSAAIGAAGRAAAGLIHQAFLLVELLFSCCEYEIVSAITAL